MLRSLYLILLMLLFSNVLHAQKKIMDFYFDGGKCVVQDKMVSVALDGITMHTNQVVLTYIKTENSMRLDFIDDNFKPYAEEIENLDAFVVKGKTEIVWRNKSNKDLAISVIEKAGSLSFSWKGEKFRVD